MSGIGVVVVTYNRMEKLKKALHSYEQQSRRPDYMIVVNNCSTDGTQEYLDSWEKQRDGMLRCVVTLCENVGGSGGFYEGLKIAKGFSADWIWVADDDAYADVRAIELLEYYIEKLRGQNIVAVCGSVWMKGEIDIWHRRVLLKHGMIREKKIQKEEYEKELFRIDLFSYVGTALSKAAVVQAGLPNSEYFIAYDDSEHSLRMKEYGDIYCVPVIRVIHDTEADGCITWKTYYGIRNKIYAYMEHFGKKQAIQQSAYYLLRFLWKGRTVRQLTKQAVCDAWRGNLGRNTYYNPGWKG